MAPGANVFTSELILGDESWIAFGAYLRGSIIFGKQCSVNSGANILGKVRFGDACRVAAYASIVGFNHGFSRLDCFIKDQPITIKGVVLGDDVWVGAGATIIDGVSIGSHSIVAAGSVVTKSFPDYSVIGGNPASLIKDRRPFPRYFVDRFLISGGREKLEKLGVRYNFDLPQSGYIPYADSQKFRTRDWVVGEDVSFVTKMAAKVIAHDNNVFRPDVIKKVLGKDPSDFTDLHGFDFLFDCFEMDLGFRVRGVDTWVETLKFDCVLSD